MKPIMNINDLNTIEQMEQFLTGSQAVAFLVASSKDECYRGYSGSHCPDQFLPKLGRNH
jgi:hypothetical protein